MGVGNVPLAFDNVSVSYGEFAVVQQFSLSLQRGEIVCLFGPSGCGKSTILKTAVAAVRQTAGSVTINGVDAQKFSEPIAYMPQENELFPWLDVKENVRLWFEESGARGEVRNAISPEDALRLVGLADATAKMPGELSGGMARRTALARCLSTHSSLMLLDETFVSIERSLRRSVMAAAREHMKQRAITALLVSHDYEEATFMSERVVFLTAVPAQISKIVSVPLPVSRAVTLFEDKQFQAATMALVSNHE